MNVQEIAALNDLRKALLSVNGAIGRLGKDKNDMLYCQAHSLHSSYFC